jgi:hypothetical protein
MSFFREGTKVYELFDGFDELDENGQHIVNFLGDTLDYVHQHSPASDAESARSLALALAKKMVETEEYIERAWLQL